MSRWISGTNGSRTVSLDKQEAFSLFTSSPQSGSTPILCPRFNTKTKIKHLKH